MASALFSPITMRGLTLPNRIVVSPHVPIQFRQWVGQRLAPDASRQLLAPRLVMTEMTDVNPQGRITASARCAGMYSR